VRVRVRGADLAVEGIKRVPLRGRPSNAEHTGRNGMDSDDWRLIDAAQAANCSSWGPWDHCAPGELEVDPWLQNALATQRQLQYDQALTNTMWVCTHNSYNARGSGYGLGDNIFGALVRNLTDAAVSVVFANQEFSMLDQLRMGVRFIEMDPHWFAGELRLCHAGGLHIPALDKLLHYIEQRYNVTIDWDSEQIGCTPWDRPFSSGLAEFTQWLFAAENADEVVVLYLDDDEELNEWNKTGLLLQELQAALGSAAFTPRDLNASFPSGGWPTIAQLLALDKHVVVANNFDYGSPSDEFMFGHFWSSQDSVGTGFTFPTCDGTVAGRDTARFLGDSTIYGPFFDGPYYHGILNETNTREFLRCGAVFPCSDQHSPFLASFAVWSWAPAQPASLDAADNCAALNATSTRWLTANCSAPLPCACQAAANPSLWSLAAKPPAPFAQCAAACAAGGASFAAPQLFRFNEALAAAAQAADADLVWINVRAT
jgi:hypothetical protein